MEKSLSDLFSVELTHTDKTIDELKLVATIEKVDSLETQREYVKKNLISLIEVGMKDLESISRIANSTESAKDFMAMTELLRTLVNTNMTLLESEVVHKPKLENTNTNSNKSPEQITNNTAVFFGTTADFNRANQPAYTSLKSTHD